MDLPSLWPALAAAGVTLRLGGTTGLIADPASAIPPECLAFIKANRADIIAVLEGERDAAGVESFFATAPCHPEGAFLAEFVRLRQGLVPTTATRLAFGHGIPGEDS